MFSTGSAEVRVCISEVCGAAREVSVALANEMAVKPISRDRVIGLPLPLEGTVEHPEGDREAQLACVGPPGPEMIGIDEVPIRKGHTYRIVIGILERKRPMSEKSKFVEFMREYEAFCGVEVLSYCILSNHFHILVAVPKRPSELPSEDELLRRLDSVSGATLTASKARQMFDMFRKAKDSLGAEEFRQSIWNRFYDVSEFMKLLKQRYTQWHNRRHQRKGTLWEERFKSVLVEGAGHVLATMAAYIDLNPVRAGIVKDPKDYRWCSYGEAMAGKKRARLGIQKIAEAIQDGNEETLTRSMEVYRKRLAIEGMENEGIREDGSPMRLGIKKGDIVRIAREESPRKAAFRGVLFGWDESVVNLSKDEREEARQKASSFCV